MRIVSLTNNGATKEAKASNVNTPGVCHSNRPPLSTLRRIFTNNWQITSTANLGTIQLTQPVEPVGPTEDLLTALLWIPHPDIITNNGAAIPPNAAAMKAPGSPTVIPFGGSMAAVCTSTMHNTATALILSIWRNLILRPLQSWVQNAVLSQ